MRLGHGQQDRVVLSLRPALHNYDILASVIGSFRQQLQEQWLGDVIGAGAGDQVAARPQELEGAEVDLLVAAAGGRNGVAVLGEGRRVEDNHLETPPGLVVFLEQVEGIAFAKSGIGNRIQLLIPAGGFDSCGRHIDALDVRATVGDCEREASLIAETIEHVSRRIAPRGEMVFALVEKRSGFLALGKVADERHAVFLGQNFGRHFAVKHADALFETLEHTHLGVVAFDDALGREPFHKNIDERAFQTVACLAERLKNEIIAIAIDDHRRQQIRFAIDQAAGVGVFDNQVTIGGGPANPRGQECTIDGNVLASQQADRNLRFVAVKRAPDEVSALVNQADDSSRFGARRTNVATVHPKMA